MSERTDEKTDSTTETTRRKGPDGAMMIGLICVGLLALLILANVASC